MNAPTRSGLDGPRRLSATLPPSALSARRAREFVAGALETARCDDPTIVERLALVTSELVTNAVIHSGTTVVLHITIDEGSVYLEVIDGGQEHPKRTPPALSDTSGRGLMLVDALVDAWGVSDVVDGLGKMVWIRVNAL